ncbi:MAG TPA: DUF1343 domain-containing protein [Gemmatimonadaceae bacterium]|nr:DUF1343 domain-containing protein [Gemmatimonadaceae bacterium]
MHRYTRMGALATLAILLACVGSMPKEHARHGAGHVRPGITVLLTDSAALIDGKRVGLLTNQTGVNEHGVSDIDLLMKRQTDKGASGPKLVALFSPEHGIRGTEDRTNLANGKDARTGIPIYSLYGATTLAPPDSVLKTLDVLAIDLQDIGARDWTFVATMVYAMRSAAQLHVRVLVLDRPNPITGTHVEGPLLDTSFAFAGSHSAARAATPTALYPIPMRHGLTLGELARFYNDVLALHADLVVVPVDGWRRVDWFDDTKLPWIKPSPNMPNLTSAELYPGIVWLEGTNISVGRGTESAFQLVGAPWLDAKKAIDLLESRDLPGVKFSRERFTPQHPGDDKYGGVSIDGIRLTITDRERLNTARLGAALIWAAIQVNKDSVRFQQKGFNQLFGVRGGREAFMSGADPDSMIDASVPATIAFEQSTRKYRIYK